MKNCLLAVLCLLLSNVLFAQLNLTFKSQVQYNESLNDVWGYAAPDGREYALVGLRGGVNIVDVTDTENPVDMGYATGPTSTWRDIKTFGTFAYVTNETSGGLLVIDLSGLPAPITEDDYYYWAPQLGNLGTLSSCHNIYIDEVGYAYLVGCNLNSGGMLYIDVFSDPGNPIYDGAGPSVYAHDIYVRDNIAYNSEIYLGAFTVYDVTDKGNTIQLGTQTTPLNFTHNAWLSDDSNFIFTTDERADAPIGAYDISDFNNIQEVDQFKPLTTVNEGVIPHNVHVWNDWLIISYYTDGCIIVDASRPNNLIEVGNFDTYIPASTGFNGVWGAYPFLPSETVLATDIGNGLFVLEPNYVRACWLEGKVTSAATSELIENVEVEIMTTELNEASTNFSGEYATGLATAGTYDVTFSHPAYQPLTTQAVLDNGVLTILDVQLDPLPTQVANGLVIDSETGNPIPDAEVFIDGVSLDYAAITDANGNFEVPAVLEGLYVVYAGSWGHINASIVTTIENAPANIVVELEEGYADDFIVDLDWQIESTASTGTWERAEPIGTFADNGNTPSNPGSDVADDLGALCYTTGNGGGSAANDDIDGGYTRFTSPVMDLSSYNEPVVKYDYWFYNGGGNGNPNDNLTVTVNNGIQTVAIHVVETPNSAWDEQVILLNDYITSTSTMTITFESSDQVNDNNGHVTEAAIDAFLVYDDSPNATFELTENMVDMVALPNPFDQNLTVKYQFDKMPERAELQVFNLLGQQIENIRLDNISNMVEINSIENSGIYFVQIVADGSRTQAVKVVKN